MEREQRYIVFKVKDIAAAFPKFNAEDSHTFNEIYDGVTALRAKQGKPPLACVVVEADWPEYEPVWNMIAKRVYGES